jgi:hypothetical protein
VTGHGASGVGEFGHDPLQSRDRGNLRPLRNRAEQITAWDVQLRRTRAWSCGLRSLPCAHANDSPRDRKGEKRMNTLRICALVLGIASTQPACSADIADGTGPDETQQTRETLVYTLQLNPTHKIDFHEYAYGMTGVHETMPVGEVEALRLPDDRARTLSELFELVKPGAEIPEALVLADARALAARQLVEEKLAQDPSFLPRDAEDEAAVSGEVHGSDGLGKDTSAAIVCSGDFYRDQWGASWYLQHFGTGFSDGARCPPAPRNVASFSAQGSITNAFQSTARHTASRILQWKQMEGDFTNKGSSKGFVAAPGSNVAKFSLWSESIAPRTISIHTMNPGGFGGLEWVATGTSPCSHLHRTIVWCTGS